MHAPPRRSWQLIGAAWLVAAGLIALHTVTILDYVALLDQAGQQGDGAAATPLKQVIPARYADAQMWLRHALDGSEAGRARVRFTKVDNAPEGREVHWSSGLPWLMRGAATLQAAAGGQPRVEAMERTLLWLNAPLLWMATVGLSAWAWRRLGLAAGLIVVCAMVGHPRFYEGFSPTYVDHHGLVNVALLGLVLGAAAMGFGWREPSAARLPATSAGGRRAAIFSAGCGAVGLWFSAAVALPTLALLGAAGLAVAWWPRRRDGSDAAQFDPALWRLWGRTGALASLGFYLLEYAPANFGWRLEVNHPLHALAWWGGAELVATLGAWRAAGSAGPRALARRLALPLFALAAAPAAIALGGTSTFLPGDPFVADLRHYVAESRSLFATWQRSGFGSVSGDVLSVLVLAPAGLLLWFRRKGDVRVLAALTLVTVALVVMGFVVMRWWLVAATAQIALVVWLVLALGESKGRNARLALTAACALFLLPAVTRIVTDHRANQRKQVAEVDLFQPLYRDLAAALHLTQPEGGVVLLADPNASAGISYYGRFQSLGTLFWENVAGLRASAAILCAGTDDEALRLLTERGVTHLAISSTGLFLGEYFRLLHPDRPLDEGRNTFGFRLASDPRLAPRWLQAIPHRRSADLAGIGGEVALFKVVPEQREDQWWFYLAVAQVARGEIAGAEQSFLKALEHVPATARASFCGFAGEAAYNYGSDALAVQMLRRGLQLEFDPGMANLAAWILATSADATVRDGAVALAMVSRVARAEPDDPAVASTLAAALAELGRFEEAVQAAERALLLVRRGSGDPDSVALLAARLDTYRARRPWRQ